MADIFKRLCTFLCFADLAIWLGTAVYFSFFAANELFAGLPQDLAGQAVGVLFPHFFLLSTVLSVVGVVLFWGFGRVTGWHGRSFNVGIIFLSVGALLNVVNLIVFLPMIQSVERKMGPFSHASDKLKAQFGMLHGSSMMLELISILCIAVVWIAISLKVEFRTSARRHGI